jgi:hypothetical protein
MDPNQEQSASFGDEPVPPTAARRTNPAKVRKARVSRTARLQSKRSGVQIPSISKLVATESTQL